MMKKLLLTTMFSVFPMSSFGQTAAEGDYRTVSGGDWTAPAIWEVRNGGEWSPALTAPTAINNVYLQTGHSITIDAANVYCKDLHFGHKGTAYGSVRLGTNNLNVNGKVRVYVITGDAVTGVDEGVFYTDQSNSTTTNSNMFLSSNTLGVLKFVGGSRNITNTGEWNSNGTVCYGEFALDAGAIGTLEVGMKFRGLTVSSGTIDNKDRFAIGSTSGSGDFVIKNGATVQFERNGLATLMASNFSNPINPSGKLEIEEGGTLILKSVAPAFNFSNYVNNGTIVYSGTAQTLLTTGISTSPAVSLDSYHKLEVAVTDRVEIPVSSAITIADQLTLTSGKLVIPETSTLTLSVGNIPTIGGSETSYIATLVNGADIGTLKVAGLSTTQTFPVGTSTNYTPVTLNPTVTSDFEINVFEGITEDATPNGTALNTDAKNNLIDAIWNINRTNGSGDCEVTLGWQAALEGADFANLTDAEIGIAQYTGGAYTTYTGTGNNALNTATATFSDFAPLSVGKLGSLSVALLSFSAQKQGSSVQLNWSTASEQNNSHFDIEHSVDGKNFSVIGTRTGSGNSAIQQNYSFTDNNPQAGVNYYRLVQYDRNGTVTTYNSQAVNISANGIVLKVYPSQNSSVVNVSINSDEESAGGNFILYSINGKKLFQQDLQLKKGVNTFEVNVPALNSGVYIASCTNGSKVITGKFIK